MPPPRPALLSLAVLAACTGADEGLVAGNGNAAAASAPALQAESAGRPFAVEPLGQFEAPWAMTFLPNGLLLVTEKAGRIRFLDPRSATPRLGTVAGAPAVDHGGQGGLGDIVPHPDFANNGLVYLSYAEAGPGDTRGAAVARGRLLFTSAAMPGAPVGVSLEELEVIWRQQPKVTGRGHYGHRLAFSPDGRYLFITNGDRQKFDPAQDMGQHLGKIVRLRADGSVPPDNPFAEQGGVAAQVWTLGHRNPLGIAFDGAGNLWAHEMGPAGGDEFNLILRGRNYGYPIVSNGDHYDGRDIPDHPTRPEFEAPRIFWNPSVSPAGLIVYSGDLFPGWRGDALMGALSGRSLIRVDLDGTRARVADRWEMEARIREVEQGPDGAVYLLEDQRDGSGGRLLRLTPAAQARR